MASQMGVSGASGTLADLSKGVSSMASMLTAEVRTATLQHEALGARYGSPPSIQFLALGSTWWCWLTAPMMMRLMLQRDAVHHLV
jgi:hypothetical protein